MNRQILLFCAGLTCALLVGSSLVRGAPVTISGVEIWDGIENPHDGDGVTLTDDNGTAVYTIPDGMTFLDDAQIWVWDEFTLDATGPIRFDFVEGGGGIVWGNSDPIPDDEFIEGSGINIYCGTRSCSPDLTFNLNDNDMTVNSSGAGFIYNEFILGGTGGSMNVFINSTTGNVEIGAINTSAPDATGGAVTVNLGGGFAAGSVTVADPAGGGGSAPDTSIMAKFITIGDIDTRADREGGAVNSGNVTLTALAPPDFSDGNFNGNTAAENVVTLNGLLTTNGLRDDNSGGNVDITAAKVVLGNGFAFDLENGAQLSLRTGVTGGGFTAADVFVDNANSGLAPSFEVFHDGVGPDAIRWAANASGNWHDTTNWVPQLVPAAAGDLVEFGLALTSPQTIFLNQAALAGSFSFLGSGGVAIAGTGTLTLAGGGGNASITATQGAHEFQARVTLDSNTVIDVADGASVEFNNRLNLAGNTLTKTGGGTVAINNVLNAGGGAVVGLAGVIAGAGTIGGNLDNQAAAVAPGNSLGILTIDGDFTQGAAGTLLIELGGLSMGEQHDKLVITGTANLAGNLDVILIDGFTPNDGDTFDILDFATLTGDFANVTEPYSFNPSNGVLTFGVSILTADCNGDGVVNSADLDCACSGGGDLNTVLTALNSLLGDADGNGTVQFPDFLLLAASFGQSGTTYTQGDFDCNGETQFADFLLLADNFGMSGGGVAAAAVPEPSCLAWLGFGGLLSGLARRRLRTAGRR